MKATVTFTTRHAATAFAIAWGRFSLRGHDMSATRADGTVEVTLHRVSEKEKRWIDKFRGEAALKRLAGFIGGSQLATIRDCLRGEEAGYFADTLERLAGIVETMPATYDQDGKGDDAVVYLHYFTGPYDSWISEKDCEPSEDPSQAQWQAFGAVRWSQNGNALSLGYICLPEIFQVNAELDFHFTPCTLRELKTRLGIQPDPLPDPPLGCTCHLKSEPRDPVPHCCLLHDGDYSSFLARNNCD